jgi:hypothetical protein
MEGNRNGSQDANLQYAIRMTFGIAHGVLLTLFSFGVALLYPALSHFSFGLFGFIIAPFISLCLTIACNLCINYVSHSDLTVEHSLSSVWIPPLGIFIVAAILMPLEMMPSLFRTTALSSLAITFVCVNCILTTILQIYAAKQIQASSGSSGPT